MTPDELRRLRAEYGLTQERAAELAMVTARTVQFWEAGKYPMPASREKLLRAALRKPRIKSITK